MEKEELEARVQLLEVAVKVLAERMPLNGPIMVAAAMKTASVGLPALEKAFEPWEAWSVKRRD